MKSSWASELAGFANMPCIVRNMTDDGAVLAMTDDNLRHREKILPMEKAQYLKMQVEATSVPAPGASGSYWAELKHFLSFHCAIPLLGIKKLACWSQANWFLLPAN